MQFAVVVGTIATPALTATGRRFRLGGLDVRALARRGPVLVEHRRDRRIGDVLAVERRGNRLLAAFVLAASTPDGRGAIAWLEAGRRLGLSIGYRDSRWHRDESESVDGEFYGPATKVVTRALVHELSITRHPANAECWSTAHALLTL